MRDLSTYVEQLNADRQRALHEVRDYGGQLVARSLNGKDALAYAPTEDELEQKLRSQDIDPADVVVSRIPRDRESDIF